MEVQKAQSEPEWDGKRRIQRKLPQADPHIPETQPQVKADIPQLPHAEKAIDARINEQHLADRRPAVRPGRLQPAQVYSESKPCQEQKVTPVAALLRIRFSRLRGHPRDERRQ